MLWSDVTINNWCTSQWPLEVKTYSILWKVFKGYSFWMRIWLTSNLSNKKLQKLPIIQYFGLVQNKKWKKDMEYMEKRKLNSEKIGKIWKKRKLNSEKIWKIWKKGKSNSDKIWKLWKKGKLNLSKSYHYSTCLSSISFHYSTCLSSIFSISFHNCLPYFPYLFTIFFNIFYIISLNYSTYFSSIFSISFHYWTY
jgi:hypothetical protein